MQRTFQNLSDSCCWMLISASEHALKMATNLRVECGANCMQQSISLEVHTSSSVQFVWFCFGLCSFLGDKLEGLPRTRSMIGAQAGPAAADYISL